MPPDCPSLSVSCPHPTFMAAICYWLDRPGVTDGHISQGQQNKQGMRGKGQTWRWYGRKRAAREQHWLARWLADRGKLATRLQLSKRIVYWTSIGHLIWDDRQAKKGHSRNRGSRCGDVIRQKRHGGTPALKRSGECPVSYQLVKLWKGYLNTLN